MGRLDRKRGPQRTRHPARTRQASCLRQEPDKGIRRKSDGDIEVVHSATESPSRTWSFTMRTTRDRPTRSCFLTWSIAPDSPLRSAFSALGTICRAMKTSSTSRSAKSSQERPRGSEQTAASGRHLGSEVNHSFGHFEPACPVSWVAAALSYPVPFAGRTAAPFLP